MLMDFLAQPVVHESGPLPSLIAACTLATQLETGPAQNKRLTEISVLTLRFQLPYRPDDLFLQGFQPKSVDGIPDLLRAARALSRWHGHSSRLA